MPINHPETAPKPRIFVKSAESTLKPLKKEVNSALAVVFIA
jgi:hypothetical protein